LLTINGLHRYYFLPQFHDMHCKAPRIIGIILYLKDGRYTIDNLAAERAIRPLTIERKNSNLFCSHGGAEQSALYHTIIATCVKQGYSVLEYLKAFFRNIIMGRRDYENLMPATIGIQSRLKKQ
jgi:hypothetical protein